MILLFDYAPVAMFVLLMLLLFLGVPIAFALSTVGVVFSLMMWGLDSTSLLTSAVWG